MDYFQSFLLHIPVAALESVLGTNFDSFVDFKNKLYKY